ncbi:MAG: hypothetical protein ACI9V1_001329 [Spirosomataceae bacterium]|jgi:hypothetical protein
MKKTIFIISVISLMYGCEKAETPAIPIKLDYLASNVSKDWFVQNVAIITTVNGADKQLNLLLDCEGDDKWTFTREGKLIVNDDISKCQGKMAERLNTFWTADDTYANITFANWRLKNVENLFQVQFAISNLSDSTMTLSGGAIIPNTKSVVINYRTRKL